MSLVEGYLIILHDASTPKIPLSFSFLGDELLTFVGISLWLCFLIKGGFYGCLLLKGGCDEAEICETTLSRISVIFWSISS